jgi:hypothetical protein
MTPSTHSPASNKYGALQPTIEPKNFKSCAQVARSATPPVTQNVSQAAKPHAAGRSPKPRKSKTSCTRSLRLRHDELKLIEEKARAYRMSVNAFIRAKALGEDYIEKPPMWLRDVLLRLYAELAGQGNNLNQLARKVNAGLATAEDSLALADQQRQPVFRVLEKLELALAGRRPPDDY